MNIKCDNTYKYMRSLNFINTFIIIVLFMNIK